MVGPQPAVRRVTNPGKTQPEVMERRVTERRDLPNAHPYRQRCVLCVTPRTLAAGRPIANVYLLVMPLF